MSRTELQRAMDDLFVGLSTVGGTDGPYNFLERPIYKYEKNSGHDLDLPVAPERLNELEQQTIDEAETKRKRKAEKLQKQFDTRYNTVIDKAQSKDMISEYKATHNTNRSRV